MPTSIEWCDETINPLGWGCYGPGGTPERPQPCSYCYARRIAARNLRPCPLCREFIPHWHSEQLDKPHTWKKHRKIFVQSMGDLMHPCTPEFQIRLVQGMIRALPRHTFMLLTKNTGRYQEFNPWPANAWLGATVTNQADADERLPGLVQVDAPVRFVSHEPLLGQIKIAHGQGLFPTRTYSRSGQFGQDLMIIKTPGLSWAIIGAMTGPGAVPVDPAWVVSLEAQYQAAGVPVFEKDSLLPLCGPGEQLLRNWPKVIP
jgi:protein gp37